MSDEVGEGIKKTLDEIQLLIEGAMVFSGNSTARDHLLSALKEIRRCYGFIDKYDGFIFDKES
jgi:hypothetical protein